MKKISLILFLAVSALFVSCEKDSDEPQSVAVGQESILGTWQVTGYLIEDGKTTTEVAGQSVSLDYTSYGKDYDMTVTFNSNPQTVVSNGSYTVVVSTTFLGQTETQELPANSAFAASEWALDGSDMIFIADEIETPVVVTELTDTKMVMVMDINEVIEDAATDSKITTSGKLTVTLEK